MCILTRLLVPHSPTATESPLHTFITSQEWRKIADQSCKLCGIICTGYRIPPGPLLKHPASFRLPVFLFFLGH